MNKHCARYLFFSLFFPLFVAATEKTTSEFSENEPTAGSTSLTEEQQEMMRRTVQREDFLHIKESAVEEIFDPLYRLASLEQNPIKENNGEKYSLDIDIRKTSPLDAVFCMSYMSWVCPYEKMDKKMDKKAEEVNNMKGYLNSLQNKLVETDFEWEEDSVHNGTESITVKYPIGFLRSYREFASHMKSPWIKVRALLGGNYSLDLYRRAVDFMFRRGNFEKDSYSTEDSEVSDEYKAFDEARGSLGVQCELLCYNIVDRFLSGFKLLATLLASPITLVELASLEKGETLADKPYLLIEKFSKQIDFSLEHEMKRCIIFDIPKWNVRTLALSIVGGLGILVSAVTQLKGANILRYFATHEGLAKGAGRLLLICGMAGGAAWAVEQKFSKNIFASSLGALLVYLISYAMCNADTLSYMKQGSVVLTYLISMGLLCALPSLVSYAWFRHLYYTRGSRDGVCMLAFFASFVLLAVGSSFFIRKITKHEKWWKVTEAKASKKGKKKRKKSLRKRIIQGGIGILGVVILVVASLLVKEGLQQAKKSLAAASGNRSKKLDECVDEEKYEYEE